MAGETPEQKQQREMVEGIASNISDLAKSVRSLLGGKMKRKTIEILLAHSTKMTRKQVGNVLDAIINLEGDYTQ